MAHCHDLWKLHGVSSSLVRYGGFDIESISGYLYFGLEGVCIAIGRVSNLAYPFVHVSVILASLFSGVDLT